MVIGKIQRLRASDGRSVRSLAFKGQHRRIGRGLRTNLTGNRRKARDMKIASGLDSITAVGGVFVIIALCTCTEATAQNGEQPIGASVRRVDSPHFLSFPSGTQNGNASHVWFTQQSSADSSATTLLHEDLDTCFRPSIDVGIDGYLRPVGNDNRTRHDGFDGGSNLFCNNPCPCVYGMVEALFLQRHPQLNDQALVNDQTTNTTLLSTSNLNFNYNPGLRAMVGVGLCDGRALEFSYLGLFSGSANATVVQPNPNSFLTFQDNLVGNVFVNTERYDVEYSSWLNSFAANFACCCGCCDSTGCGESCGESCGEGGCGQSRCQSLTWFSGFRYLNFGERFNMSAQRTVAAATESGSYNISTSNHLYGGQLGARIRRTRGRFGWEGSGAAGVYLNNSQQSQSVTDFPNFPLRNASNSGNGAAFVGDTNLSGIYRLNNVWNLRAGYNVMWIQGLALAPNQLDSDFAAAQGGTNLDNGGGMLLHGVNVGIEARY